MNEPTLLRRLAEALLSAALAIAPSDTLEWGQAMLSELRHVEGNWSAFLWSLGSAGVLAKHALVVMIFPGANRSGIPSGGDLFSKEGSMRKPALAVIASCVVASLLFFLAPVFRQAFQVSLAQWHDVFHTDNQFGYSHADPEVAAFARKAEQNHDAEAVAFAALHSPNPSQAVPLADEAVKLDPKLTWVFAVTAVRFYDFPEIDRWVAELEKYDAQNALPYLITAEKSDIDEVDQHRIHALAQDRPRVWQDALGAAFNSQKLDTYSSRVTDLERRVLSRYRIDDPLQVLDFEAWWSGLPSYAMSDVARYGKLLLERGETFEAQGDRKGAFEKYSQVARFAQLVGDQGPFVRNVTLRAALSHLEALSRKEGNAAEADFYASLAERAERQQQGALIALRARGRGDGAFRWAAFMTRVSGALLVFSGLLLLAGFAAVIIRGRTFRLAALRPSRFILLLASSASVVALLATLLLYISYVPYSEMLQRFESAGDVTGLRELADFVEVTKLPLGTGNNSYIGYQDTVANFWMGVAILCALALVFGVLRYLQTRPRTTAA